MYVSSIDFRGNTLVSDGFDNQVLVLRLGVGEPGPRVAPSVEDGIGV